MKRSKLPELLDLAQERIRTLHYTWIAFFITFYVWFNMAPLATTMLRAEGGPDGWLTPEHLKLLAICNVALTIPARIVIGALIDRYGPRKCFSGLLIFCAIPTFLFAFGNSFLQLLIARLVLSCVGAGFVIGIRLTAQWFPPKMIGRAEGFYAGWGNFGSAWAAMTLPWVALDWFGGGENGWRYAIAVNGLVALAYGIVFPFLVKDVPGGAKFVGVKKTQPLLVESKKDLVSYLLWSFPLVAAMGLLAWRASRVPLGAEGGERVLSQTGLWIAYGVLGLVFLGHVVKSIQVNLPHLKKPVAPDMKLHFPSVAALNTTYFANFGAELAVVSMLPAFFESTFRASSRRPSLRQHEEPQGNDDRLHGRHRLRLPRHGLHHGRMAALDRRRAHRRVFGLRSRGRGRDVRGHSDDQQTDDRSGRRNGGRVRQRRRRRLSRPLRLGRRPRLLPSPRRGRGPQRARVPRLAQRAGREFRRGA
jgi:MFS transporter, NNP family, nitrate/nitrite transporter